jgi:pheromone shutdown protein TraB
VKSHGLHGAGLPYRSHLNTNVAVAFDGILSKGSIMKLAKILILIIFQKSMADFFGIVPGKAS